MSVKWGALSAIQPTRLPGSPRDQEPQAPPTGHRDLHVGGFLVRILVLVGAPRGRTGLFFCLPGRGVHLGGAASKWGGRGRPVGHAAVPPAALPLAGPRGAFFFRGVPSEISGWIERAGSARPGAAKFKEGAPLEDELQIT